MRGFSAVSLLLVDEAARVDDEMYLAIRPMLAVSRRDAVADEHAVREAGILLRDVGEWRGGLGAGAGAGGRVSADRGVVSGRGAKDDGRFAGSDSIVPGWWSGGQEGYVPGYVPSGIFDTKNNRVAHNGPPGIGASKENRMRIRPSGTRLRALPQSAFWSARPQSGPIVTVVLVDHCPAKRTQMLGIPGEQRRIVTRRGGRSPDAGVYPQKGAPPPGTAHQSDVKGVWHRFFRFVPCQTRGHPPSTSI